MVSFLQLCRLHHLWRTFITCDAGVVFLYIFFSPHFFPHPLVESCLPACPPQSLFALAPWTWRPRWAKMKSWKMRTNCRTAWRRRRRRRIASWRGTGSVRICPAGARGGSANLTQSLLTLTQSGENRFITWTPVLLLQTVCDVLLRSCITVKFFNINLIATCLIEQWDRKRLHAPGSDAMN